ncbi:MAG: holo-ACP synthase [Candidatus Krumholzibacteriota bacterium]
MGVGIDIVSVQRMDDLLQRHGTRFLDRCFRTGDLLVGETGAGPEAGHVAGRWAAKEAFLKALGADVRGVPYRDIEVRKEPGGPVSLALHGKALSAMNQAGGLKAHLSISHEREFAVATVLVED